VQGEVAPLVAFGLLQHETRLSVLNFSVKKASTFQEPLANKAPLLFVMGFRYGAAPLPWPPLFLLKLIRHVCLERWAPCEILRLNKSKVPFSAPITYIMGLPATACCIIIIGCKRNAAVKGGG